MIYHKLLKTAAPLPQTFLSFLLQMFKTTKLKVLLVYDRQQACSAPTAHNHKKHANCLSLVQVGIHTMSNNELLVAHRLSTNCSNRPDHEVYGSHCLLYPTHNTHRGPRTKFICSLKPKRKEGQLQLTLSENDS